jgi:hypothetical protein
MLVCAFALLLAAAGPIWTVDDDGPADFHDLPQAIAAVSAGDTLLVEPGSYSAFVLDKRLTILGRSGGERPFVAGESHVVGVPSVTLAGLRLQELLLTDVPGRLVIDDCAIGHTGTVDIGVNATCSLTRCEQVLVTRTSFQGKSGDDWHWESPGLELYESRVVLSDCEVDGGPGGDGDGFYGWPGATGLLIDPDCDALLAGTSVRGGDGGPCIPMGGYSDGGDGVLVLAPSTLTMRGSSWDVLSGGSACGLGADGWAITGNGTVVLSGVSVHGITSIDPIEPDPPEPYLLLTGGAAPGDDRLLELFGPAGLGTWVGIALSPDLLALPAGGLVWLDVDALVVLTFLQCGGQEQGVHLRWTVPPDPALTGLAVPVQGFCKSSGAWFVANPSQVVVRF